MEHLQATSQKSPNFLNESVFSWFFFHKPQFFQTQTENPGFFTRRNQINWTSFAESTCKANHWKMAMLRGTVSFCIPQNPPNSPEFTWCIRLTDWHMDKVCKIKQSKYCWRPKEPTSDFWHVYCISNDRLLYYSLLFWFWITLKILCTSLSLVVILLKSRSFFPLCSSLENSSVFTVSVTQKQVIFRDSLSISILLKQVSLSKFNSPILTAKHVFLDFFKWGEGDKSDEATLCG